MNWLYVALGGALGSIGRYGLGLLISRCNTTGIPLHTLAINVAGSFAIGLIAALAGRQHWLQSHLWYFLAVGICGGFTTFSSFSLENLELLHRGTGILALLYISLSLVLGIGACWVGFRIAS